MKLPKFTAEVSLGPNASYYQRLSNIITQKSTAILAAEFKCGKACLKGYKQVTCNSKVNCCCYQNCDSAGNPVAYCYGDPVS